jgi:hypothetical protein
VRYLLRVDLRRPVLASTLRSGRKPDVGTRVRLVWAGETTSRRLRGPRTDGGDFVDRTTHRVETVGDSEELRARLQLVVGQQVPDQRGENVIAVSVTDKEQGPRLRALSSGGGI